MNELALFAGVGGGILAGKLLGWRTVGAVEINPYRARRLMQRQNEGHLPPFPIWDDVRTFDGRPWRDLVDMVSAGFPCTDISRAGTKEGSRARPAGYGWKYPASFAKYNPDSHSWRTRQSCLIEGLAEFSGTWPNWGSMHDGVCSDLTTSAPSTSATGRGSWPTPCHGSSHWGGTYQEVGGSKNKLRGTPTGKLYVNPDFWESLMGWPIGWTGTAPLETAKTRAWLLQHSRCLARAGSEAA